MIEPTLDMKLMLVLEDVACNLYDIITSLNDFISIEMSKVGFDHTAYLKYKQNVKAIKSVEQ